MDLKKLSSEMIEVIPTVMRAIRSDMRGVASPELSVAQFRILARLARESHSNKELAEWAGVSTAAMSRTIEVLVGRGYVLRKTAENDRREVVLGLSTAGKKKYETIKGITKLKLIPKLEKRSNAEIKILNDALLILLEIFDER